MTRSLLCGCLLAATLHAREARGQDDPASRSEMARTALRRAAQSDRAGLADSAWADIVRAQAAWPDQPAYTETLARWSARRGDLVNLERALATLAAQGTGAATSRDSIVRARASGDPRVSARLAALEAALAPVGNAREHRLSADTALWPEGIDIDRRSQTIFVASIRRRELYAFEPNGTARPMLSSASPRPAAVMGVVVDTLRDRLWVTTMGHRVMEGYVPADSAASELLEIARVDGRVIRRWGLGDGTGAPGEIGLAPDGEVVVSDAIKGVLYRLRPGRDTLERLGHRLLRSPQGIAFSRDGRSAWVADWSHGILRWDRLTGAITALAIDGGATLVGIDGLRLAGDRLIGVQNGVGPARVVAITISADGTRATAVRVIDRPAAYPGEPTVGVVADGEFVYIASSHWPFYDDDGTRTSKAPLPSLILRRIPLAP